MSFLGDLLGWFLPGPVGEVAERAFERQEYEMVVDDAIYEMQSMAGNEGQYIILTDKVPKPFKNYFMDYAYDFGPDPGSYESWMRSEMGSDEYWQAVEIILMVGFDSASMASNYF